MCDTRVRSLGQEDPLEKGMATHSSFLAWRIPWTEGPDRLPSMGSQRVGHDWATVTFYEASCITKLWKMGVVMKKWWTWLPEVSVKRRWTAIASSAPLSYWLNGDKSMGPEPPSWIITADRAAGLKKPQASVPTLGYRAGRLEERKTKSSPAQAIVIWGFPLPDAKGNPKHLSRICLLLLPILSQQLL